MAVPRILQWLIIFTVSLSLAFAESVDFEDIEADVTQEPTQIPTGTKHEIRNIDGMQWKIKYKPSECHEESDYGDRLEAHYTGYLENGAVFDSTIQKQRPPIGFTLGAKQVIEGWEKGLKGMCVGEIRRLVIPPHLGYGETGYPPTIPPRTQLLFEITLMSLRKKNTLSIHINSCINLIKLLGPPLMIVYLLYFLWSRYKTEMAEQKDEKKRGKKRK